MNSSKQPWKVSVIHKRQRLQLGKDPPLQLPHRHALQHCEPVVRIRTYRYELLKTTNKNELTLLIMAILPIVLSRLVLDRVTCNNIYQCKILEPAVMGVLELRKLQWCI